MKANVSRKALTRALTALALVSGVITVFGFACSKSHSPESLPQALNDGGGGFTDTRPPAFVKPATANVGIPVLSQTYASFVSVLQLEPVQISQASRDEYTKQATNLSETGRLNSIGSSFQVAVTQLSAQLCLDKINAEAAPGAVRTLFAEIDLTQGGVMSDGALAMVINRLARAAWQRDESDEERKLLTAAVNESISIDPTAGAGPTRNALLVLCTAVLASVSGIQM